MFKPRQIIIGTSLSVNPENHSDSPSKPLSRSESSSNPGRRPDQHKQLKYFVAGGFGGLCTVFLGYPFDTIKTKLQVSRPTTRGGPPLYTGSWDCAYKTLHERGLQGLYKGVTAPLVGVAPITAISYVAFSVGKQLEDSADDAVYSRLQLFTAGAFSGLLTAFAIGPGERVKCLLQVQEDISMPRTYQGSMDCVRQLYQEGGFRSVFRGTAATILRDVPGTGVYFMVYERLQTRLQAEGGSPNLFTTAIAGGLAGSVFWVVASPADIMKTRLQIAPEGRYPRGLRDVFGELVREEGLAGLYKGCLPVVLRSFPANATCFLVFELAMHYLNKLW